jgi:hypothetical protein
VSAAKKRIVFTTAQERAERDRDRRAIEREMGRAGTKVGDYVVVADATVRHASLATSDLETVRVFAAKRKGRNARIYRKVSASEWREVRETKAHCTCPFGVCNVRGHKPETAGAS